MIVREKQTYTMVSNEFLNLDYISWAAKGYYCYLQSLDNEEFESEMEIVQGLLENDCTCNCMDEFDELMLNGYLKLRTEK